MTARPPPDPAPGHDHDAGGRRRLAAAIAVLHTHAAAQLTPRLDGYAPRDGPCTRARIAPAHTATALDAARTVMAQQPAHEPIMRGDELYLARWWLSRPAHGPRTYLHSFEADDDDCPHNHPWPSAGWVLDGTITEYWWSHGARAHLDAPRIERLQPGDVRVRSACHTHRLCFAASNAVTLFATGAKCAHWGYWQPDGRFTPWQIHHRERFDEHHA